VAATRPIDPMIAFEDGCPIFASSSIGVTHYATLPLAYGLLGYDLDLERASERPSLLLPDFANFPALGIGRDRRSGQLSGNLPLYFNGAGLGH
jgi:hypothetical protein